MLSHKIWQLCYMVAVEVDMLQLRGTPYFGVR